MQQEQPQAPGNDPDVDTYETMTAALIKHIFGAGEQGIIKRLREGKDDLPSTIGTLALTMTQEAARQAEEAQRDFDLEMLIGVATEVIESLMKLAEAIGIIDDAEDQRLLEDSLLQSVQAYMMTAEITPEEQEAAQQMLQQMQGDGLVDQATSEISRIGAERGVDPFADDVDPAPGAAQPAAPTARPRPLISEA